MSIIRSYSVFCDVQGPDCIGWVVQTVEGAKAARQEARGNGWVRKRQEWEHHMVDVCPPCQFTHPVCSDCETPVHYFQQQYGWLHAGDEEHEATVLTCPRFGYGGTITPKEKR